MVRFELHFRDAEASGMRANMAVEGNRTQIAGRNWKVKAVSMYRGKWEDPNSAIWKVSIRFFQPHFITYRLPVSQVLLKPIFL